MKKTTAKKYILISMVILFMLALLPSSSVFGANDKTTIEQDYKELEQKKKDYEQAVADRANAKKQIEVIASQLSSLEKDKVTIEQEIVYIDSQIEALDLLIEAYEPIVLSLSEDVKKLEAQREKYLQQYADIVRSSFIEGDPNVFQIIFQSESFSDFLTRLDFSANVLEYSSLLLDTIEENRVLLEKSQNDYNNAIISLNGLKDDQYLLKQEYSDKYTSLLSLQEEYESQQEEYIGTVAELSTELAEIDDEIDKIVALIKDKEYKAEGNWARPLPTNCVRFSSPWGWRVVFGERDFHYGNDFPCSTGTEVYAVEKGTVVMSEYRGGYGWLVVVYHGGGLQTYYAHNSKNLVKVGDEVDKGQLVSLSGNTGKSTGPHLHFGVKLNGSFVDPETKDENGNFIYLDTSSFTRRSR